jgi:phage shock protein PspC (stress-responsive transcriptional regulator)
MTSTPPEAPTSPSGQPGPTGSGPRVTREDLRNLDRLRRTTGANKYVAGVAGGVARHFDIDPAIVRVLFVVLTFFGGTGLMLYGALWLLLPEDDGDQAIINLDSRSLTFALLAVLVFGAVLLVGDSWGGYGFPWPLTVIGLVVAVVLLSRDRRNSPTPPPVSYTPYVPGSAAAPATGEQATDDAATTAAYEAQAAYPAYPVLPPGYQPPTGAWQPPPAPPRPANPRKRGPILFWFTMALAALGVGILGVVDVSGADVPWSAYPALVLAVTGLMLLVGAFFGRAGGLILVGLLAAVAMAGGTVGERFDGDVMTSVPTSAAQVQDTYEFKAGEMVLDLSELDDPENLDGRTIRVDGELGRIEVIVPDDVDVQVDAFVDGLGDTSVFGEHDDGVEPRVTDTHDVRDEVATFSLDADLSVGEIVVHTAREATR